MAYDKKPEYIRTGSLMHEAFKILTKESLVRVADFPTRMRKDAIYPAYRHGFVKIYRNGLVRLNAAGKKMLASAK